MELSKKGKIMKKSKNRAFTLAEVMIVLTLSMFSLLFSSVYTILKNKPENEVMRYEKWVFQIFGK